MSTTEQLDVKLDKFRLVKHMNSPDDIRAIIVLKNGTVAFATLRTLYIYQKDNLFKPSLTISLDNSVYSLIELPDGSLVAATKGLLIWTISEYCDRAKLKGTIKSDNEIGEVLLLPGDRFACSFFYNSDLYFFKSTMPYSDTPIHKIETSCNSKLTYMKERDELQLPTSEDD